MSLNLYQLEYLANKIWIGEKVDNLTLSALAESHVEASRRLELIDRICAHFLDVEDKDFWQLRATIMMALTHELPEREQR